MIVYLVGTIATLLGIALIALLGRFFSLWLQAYFADARISLLSLVVMSLRRVDPAVIVRCKVMAAQANLLDLSTDAIEAQYLAGGNVLRVVTALIVASRSGIELDWNTAAAIDLAGRDIMEAVQVSVNPRIIDCPNPKDAGRDMLYGVSKDGIQLKVRVRVTVRTNLRQLVGGATESTIVARVGQSIISAIGSCDSYLDALGDPAVISRQVVAEGLDAQTAFSIVSIDIADIDVGSNIGAKLAIDQADADVRIARANAENRRALAVARFHEMKAEVAGSRSKLMLAAAEVPVAIAFAFRAGCITTVRSRDRDVELSKQKLQWPNQKKTRVF